MARTPAHSCTYFDDGELTCGCGRRAEYVLDEDTLELVLVALVSDDASAPLGRQSDGPFEELAVSA